MASEAVIDIDSLIQPIQADQPTGTNIRDDISPSSQYYAIKDARNTARSLERNSLFDPDAASDILDQWRLVLKQAPDILRAQSKDLEVCAWYTEALVRLRGFAGLRDGFQLIFELVQRFWDPLYPKPDEDGVETKVAALTGLNGEGGEGTLIAPIRNVLITEGLNGSAMTFWQYQQAREIEKIKDEEVRLERIESVQLDPVEVKARFRETSALFYRNQVEDLQQTLDIYQQLDLKLDQLCGSAAPPSSNVRNTLEEILSTLKYVARDKLASLQPATAEDDQNTVDENREDNPGTPLQTAATSVENRAQALRQLSQIADFFRTSEPHSPLAGAIERIVRWGHMDMATLMNELIADDNARVHFSQLTGINLAAGEATADDNSAESGWTSTETESTESGW